ncbi:protein belonging to Uncharacterized protein family UPF0175 [Candidatus Magnetomorum sp. HK-1]|nr:protein belonging to Uncharacterized protein family UPF0175 [Candidatus Magnetomorum sp. HK-1]
MNTTTLNVPVETDIFLALNQTKDEFTKDLKRWAAISMFVFGKISLPRAASLAGYHRYDFEKMIADLNINISNLNENDAINEINTLQELS